jgi:hypothetical protein
LKDFVAEIEVLLHVSLLLLVIEIVIV